MMRVVSTPIGTPDHGRRYSATPTVIIVTIASIETAALTGHHRRRLPITTSDRKQEVMVYHIRPCQRHRHRLASTTSATPTCAFGKDNRLRPSTAAASSRRLVRIGPE